jgi:hypothetical protein
LNRLDFPTCESRLIGAHVFARGVRQQLHDAVEQVAGRTPVHAGHRERLAESERMEDGSIGLVLLGVDLVRHQDDRHVGPAESGRQHAVVLGDAGLGVDDEQDEVGVREGSVGLIAGEGLDAGRTGEVAGGVDESEAAASPHGVELDAIAGDARHVVGDRLTVAEQPVDQGRFADILAADDRDAGYPRGLRGLNALALFRHDISSGARSRTTSSAAARVSALPSALVSIRTAPGAGRCGFVRASRASRACSAASVSADAPARSAARRRARTSGRACR